MPQLGVGCCTPNPRKLRSGLGQQRVAEAQRDLHEQRRDRVREDVPAQHAEVADTDGSRRLDIGLLAHGEHLRPHESHEPGHERDADRDRRREDALVENDRHDERERDRREGEHGVGDPGDHVIGPRAEVAGDEPEGKRDDHREDHDEEADLERDARAEDEAGERVATVEVGSEPVRATGAGSDVERVGDVGILARDERRRERARHEEDEEAEPAHRRNVAAEASDDAPARGLQIIVVDGHGVTPALDLGLHAHAAIIPTGPSD